MTAIEKFTFSLSFDDADNVIRSSGTDDEHYETGRKKKKPEEEAPPPPPAIYTEEQAAQMIAEAEARAADAARAEGHMQGLEQGRQEILASIEQAMNQTAARIADHLEHLDEQQKRANARINEDAVHVAVGIMRKIAPAWSKRYEMAEIEDIVRQCLANLFDAPKVIVQVHPQTAERMGEHIEKIARSRGFTGNVAVVGEPDIAQGDCLVSWGDGTARRETGMVWAEINAIVDRILTNHAQDHGLPPNDMGDAQLQETRMAPPPPIAPPAPVAGDAPNRIAGQMDSEMDGDMDGQMAPNAAPETATNEPPYDPGHSASPPDGANMAMPGTMAPEMAPETPQGMAAQGDGQTGDDSGDGMAGNKEVNGTKQVNMPTSPEQVAPGPHNPAQPHDAPDGETEARRASQQGMIDDTERAGDENG